MRDGDLKITKMGQWGKTEEQSLSLLGKDDHGVEQRHEGNEEDQFLPPPRPDLPSFTREEICKRTTLERGIWVTYKNGVYDITKFYVAHPGSSENILLAAGGAVEPFWNVFAQHKTQQVMELLETLRIGNLDAEEAEFEAEIEENDPFADEPKRHPALKVNQLRPFNAETPVALIPHSFHTPNPLFFTRNHLPVPHVDMSTFRLSVEGDARMEVSVEGLKKRFKTVKISSVIMCAGNRRSEFNKIRQVKGLEWDRGAISNAEWTGVRLRDLLRSVGVTEKSLGEEGMRHVEFVGMDEDPTGSTYAASIPLKKALQPEVIVAFEMNGEPIPLDHGYPLRVIVPGCIGARQVKWLKGIRVGKEESQSHWQQQDYRAFSPSADFGDVDYSSMPAIQESPVQSAICSPLPNTQFPPGTKRVVVEGYAWSGQGRAITRVDVSVDGGKTWQVATLRKIANQAPDETWAWTLWKAEMEVGTGVAGEVEVVCKATNLSYNTQPDTSLGIWNFRGLLNNSWHHLPIFIQPTK